mmetsp:Transcript_53786/g.80257  ORF Transcript_53786/g.80257 Transcript_53786/m.80257 type:complete len:128 (-) Transcript_53786:184-567(-)
MRQGHPAVGSLLACGSRRRRRQNGAARCRILDNAMIMPMVEVSSCRHSTANDAIAKLSSGADAGGMTASHEIAVWGVFWDEQISGVLIVIWANVSSLASRAEELSAVRGDMERWWYAAVSIGVGANA